MGNLVIVAIPEEQDRVWKVSSEKVPHLTLLFLGDEANADTQQIVQFVEHAVTLSEHGQFYLDVDRRDTLGPDDADVLFFSKRSWNLKWIKQFRGQLLQNNAVRTAYDSTQQYDEWVPHLTLGYPDTPAKPLPDDGFLHPIYSVCFDRIAVWTTDYDGPDFRLEWPEREMTGDLAVAYSDTQKAGLPIHAENGLEHIGVKGMRWGFHRRNKGAEDYVRVGESKKDAKDAKVDAKWLKSDVRGNGLKMSKAEKKIFDTANKTMKSEAKAINKKPEYTGRAAKKEFKKSDSSLRKQYDKEHQDLFVKHMQLAAEKHLHPSQKDAVSPSGKWQKDLRTFKDGSWMVGIKQTDTAKHATDAFDFVAHIRPIRDDDGYIVNFELVENSMSQTAELGREFLAHKSVLDNATLSEQIKAKIQSILDDVTGGTDKKDVALFGDPLIRTKLSSVLDDFYKNPNVDNAVVYDALGEAFIEHFGIKGMRWGFRRSGTTPSAVSSQSTHTLLRGKAKVQTQGGEHHPAHEDAIKVAEAKQKLKKSGVAALSNKDLQDVATRVNLENQVAVLTSSKGKKFVTTQLHEEGKTIARRGIREGLKRGAKRAAKVAGTAAAVAA